MTLAASAGVEAQIIPMHVDFFPIFLYISRPAPIKALAAAPIRSQAAPAGLQPSTGRLSRNPAPSLFARG
jgi:hypothetical protein